MFTYLNRSARVVEGRVREVLEAWFSRYPVAEHADLRGRFRSKNDFHHLSAFFELFLHELLIRLDCRVEIHPRLSGDATRHPDYLVKSAKRGPFYIEAVVVSDETAEQAAARARMNDVYDVLNRMESPDFFVGMKLKGAPKTSPPAKRIKSFLAERIRLLDPDKMTDLFDAGGFDALPHWRYEHGGWQIDFFPIPKSADKRGKTGVRPLGLWFHEFTLVTTHQAVRNAIVSKGGRYGDLDLPYIIAVNVCGHPWDDTDAMEALFGTEQWTVDFTQSGETKVEPTRARDGAWVNESGPRYTRISSVLMVNHVTPWHISERHVRLWHNPRAQRPYDSELTCLPQALLQGNRMEMVEGQSTATIFGLPLRWPEE